VNRPLAGAARSLLAILALLLGSQAPLHAQAAACHIASASSRPIEQVSYRDYDPLHGRWTSEDPMGMMDGWNRYHGYMGPNGTDPEGTVTSWAGAGIGAAAGAVGYAAFGWMGPNGYTKGGWAGAIAGGALTGAVIGSFGVDWSATAVIGGGMLAAGAGGGTGSIIQQGIDHGSVNWGQVGTDAAFSGATAGLLGGAGAGIRHALTNTGAGRYVGGLMLAGALRFAPVRGGFSLPGASAAFGESAGSFSRGGSRAYLRPIGPEPANDVAILKSIRRMAERLGRGDVVSANPDMQQMVRQMQRHIRRGNFNSAGTMFHSMNFRLARAIQAGGSYLRGVRINSRVGTPGGIRPTRIPDYRLPGGAMPDLKPFKNNQSFYDATDQFADLLGATGQRPYPLYYHLW
jgi:hypothetical protein